MRQILKVFYLATAVLLFSDACSFEKDDGISKVDIQLKHSYGLRSFNLSSQTYNLSVVASWSIPEGTNVTGFLYRYSDQDQNRDSFNLHSSIPIIPDLSSFVEICESVKDTTIWAADENGNSVQCQVPCEGIMPPPCMFSKVCQSLENKYISVSKETRTLSFPALFGRAYEFEIMAYNGWSTGLESTFDLRTHTLFCRHELITNHGVDPDVASEFCKHQKLGENSHSTGPVSNLTRVEMYRDMSRNRGVAVFEWQDPHDIHFNVTIKHFALNALRNNGKLKNWRISIADDDGFYRAVVTDIVFGKEVNLQITPITDTSKCGKCTAEGVRRFATLSIPDIDACVGDNMTRRYCDPVANCSDFPLESVSAAANCSCPVGYKGNGISVEFDEGEGCTDFDSCSDEHTRNATCVPEADCTDIPPPSLGVTCSCPSDYVGDGYRSGSGCTSRSLVIGLPVGIVLSAVLVLAVVAMMVRCKRLKKRKLDKKVSHFLNGDLTFTSGRDVLKNGHTTRGAERALLGDKWEVDRDLIEFKGIIGRGNFGVVQRAVLKTDDSEVHVAVKVTSDNPPERLKTAFLSEIAMIASLGSHQNLIGMIGCCTVGDEPIYMVSKYMKYGDLLHFLWKAREERYRTADPIYNITELNIYHIGCQVASGMQYLKEIKVIHGDLAARNILMGEGLECKISDFGLANDVYRYGMITGAVEKTVPLKWISPERMMGGKVPITWRSDVWSFGILLHEAITLGASPYPDIAGYDLFEKLKSGYRMAKPDYCSQYLFNIMSKCWEWVALKRPSFKSLEEDLKSPYSNSGAATYVNLTAVVSTLDERETPAAAQEDQENDRANAASSREGADLA